jgi:hypothetical protein
LLTACRVIVEARAEFVQRLAIIGAQPVKQFPTAGIGQRFENFIHIHNMQPFGCLSRTKFLAGACPSCGARRAPAGRRIPCAWLKQVGHFVIEDLRRDFRFWHKADISMRSTDVRFWG